MAQDLISTLASLVRINSVNPAYEGGRPEREIAGWIDGFFARHGIETRTQEVFPELPNLIAWLAGRSADRRLIFEAHTDTVSTNGMSIPPHDPVVSEGRLYGRAPLSISVRPPATTHEVSIRQLEKWTATAAKSPHEVLLKSRVRVLLERKA